MTGAGLSSEGLGGLKLYELSAFEKTLSSYPLPFSIGLFHSWLVTNSFSLLLFIGLLCFCESRDCGLGFRLLASSAWLCSIGQVTRLSVVQLVHLENQSTGSLGSLGGLMRYYAQGA